ncbi:MAG: hypothetical protein EA417_01075 [Gammaproteobacteria bacterium]|nr:MAG: hypothetical protein EA417_01075 [Gammaproteobacteria bacterium]
MSIYEQGLDRNAPNFRPLSPVAFVERSAEALGDLPAAVHGGRRDNWAQCRERSARLAAALQALGIGRLDPKWGEIPLAFVELKPDAVLSAAELLAHCRDVLAGFKCPREIRLEAVPKTSTGKIQKFMLRERARMGYAST